MIGENGKISHIQRKRQYQLTFFVPFLLFVSPHIQSGMGILAVALTVPCFCALIWIVGKMETSLLESRDIISGRRRFLFVLAVQIFLVVAGVWISLEAGNLIAAYMLLQIPWWGVLAIFVLVSLAVGRNLQVRGRFAEISWPLVCVLTTVFYCFAGWQGIREVMGGKWDLREHFRGFWEFSWEKLWESILTLAAAFAGTLLLPFAKVYEQTADKKRKKIQWAPMWLGMWLVLTILLQQLYFGSHAWQSLSYPLLDLMAGVRLPGDFIRRLDLIFLTIMLFGLLFTMGSICFYSGYLWEKVKISMGRIPLLVLIFVLVTLLSGCQIVEPEKRAYPLVLGLDWDGEEYVVFLAMAQIAQSTGQEKTGSEQDTGTLLLRGKDVRQIQEEYDTGQELYLDVGHVQAVVFGESLLCQKERMEMILGQLEQNHNLGNSAYVYSTDAMEALFAKNQTQITSLGDYLTGLYENRQKKRMAPTLLDVYREMHNKDCLLAMPKLKVSEDNIRLIE